MKGLKRWEEEDVVTDYVSNRALQLIQEIRGGALTEKLCKELRTHLDLALDNITNELSELRISIHETEKDIKEKQDAVEDLQNDRKPYPLELKKARQELQRALSDRYGRKSKFIFSRICLILRMKNGKMRSKDGLAGLKKV